MSTINSGYNSLFGWVPANSSQSSSSSSGTVLPIIHKGDLITRDATHATNLAVGLDNQLLTADSTTATGLNWKSTANLTELDATTVKASTTQTNLITENTFNSGVRIFTTGTSAGIELDGPYLMYNPAAGISRMIFGSSGVDSSIIFNGFDNLQRPSIFCAGGTGTWFSDSNAYDIGIRQMYPGGGGAIRFGCGNGVTTLAITSSNVALTLPLQLNNAVSGYTPSNFNYYEEGTFSVTFGGAINSTTKTVRFTRVGAHVSLVIPLFTGTYSGTSGSISASGSIPSRLRLAATTALKVPVCVQDGSPLSNYGGFVVNNLGDIFIFAGLPTVSFSGPGTVGILADLAVTYTIN